MIFLSEGKSILVIDRAFYYNILVAYLAIEALVKAKAK